MRFDQAVVENCVVLGEKTLVRTKESNGRIECSLVQRGWPGVGNIDTLPGFVSVGDHPYALRKSSACIDAGNPMLRDGLGWPRRYGNEERSDMGIYSGPCNGLWANRADRDCQRISAVLKRLEALRE